MTSPTRKIFLLLPTSTLSSTLTRSRNALKTQLPLCYLQKNRKQSSFDASQDEPPQEKGYVSSSNCYVTYKVLKHDLASRFFKDSPNQDEQTANAEFNNLSADFDAGIVGTGGRGGDSGSGGSGAATIKKKREYTFLFLSAISM
jgi:hypothetical protein